MQKLLTMVVGVALVVTVVAPAWAGYLCITDTSSGKGLMLFNSYNGAVVDPNWLSMAANGCGNPIAAQVVGTDEFWVTDKSNDQVMRYQLSTKAFLGVITSSNIVSPMGLEVSGNTAWVANASSSLKKVAVLNVPTHSVTGTFAAGSAGAGVPYDVQLYNPGDGLKLLVDDQAQKNLDLFTLSGTFVRTLHHSTASGDYNQPQQMSITASNTVLVAGSTSPYGVYEFDPNGVKINSWTRTTGVRGVYALGNGNIIFTDSGGVHTLDRGTGTVTDVLTGRSCNYIEYGVPEPASLTLLLTALAALRRR